jgi:Tfp pilus assembly protein PilO
MNRMHWIAVGGLIGGLVLLGFGGWQFLLRPLGAAYEAKVAEKAVAEEKLKDTKSKAAQFERFQAEAENVRRDLDFYSRRLDSQLSSAELYTLVDSLGHSLNLENWSYEFKIRDKAKGAGADLDETYVKVKFKADLDQTGRLLNACLNQARIVVPDFMVLERTDDPSGTYHETLNGTIEMRVFTSTSGAK